MGEYELRAVRPEEEDAYLRAVPEGFQGEARDEELALWRGSVAFDRTLVAVHEGAIVATSEAMALRLSVPGGTVPVAGVTAVGVHAVHRRRGLLDAMMRGHLAAVRERGEEPLVGLWASEAALYGRWGFGAASRTAHLTVRSPEARLSAAPTGPRLRAGTPEALLGDLRAVHVAIEAGRAGVVARDDDLWRFALTDFEADRDGAGRLRAVVQDGPDGPAGYALFAVRAQRADNRPDDVVEVRELLATTPAATAGLWAHLIGMSLARSVVWPLAPEDEPLPLMLDDPRAVTVRLEDALYLRVIDLPAALAARTYAAPVDVVLDVEDAACPWNTGRWRLSADASGAACAATGAAADLVLGARELGAVYLGGTSLAGLAAAGRVREATPGALAAASVAFAGVRPPWCFHDF